MCSFSITSGESWILVRRSQRRKSEMGRGGLIREYKDTYSDGITDDS